MGLERSRVLIVDGEEDVRDAHRRSLAASDLDVHVEATAARAVEEVTSKRYDLVIVDESVSDTDGFALIEKLRAMDVTVSVILLARGIDNALTLRANGMGALCLQKPVDADVLLTAALQRIASRVRATAQTSSVAAEFLETVTATRAKNEFGRLLDTALRKGPVAITKHEQRHAVLMSMADYASLAEPSSPRLDLLTREFDELLARMQSSEARSGAESLFSASPAELGDAALNAAKDR